MDIPKLKLNDGVEIPTLGYGTWQLEGDVCVKGVQAALESGYTHIDTAQAYYNEIQVGEGLRNTPRQKYFLTSKLWREFFDEKAIEPSVDKSLKELGVDYLDLFVVHWPDKNHMLDIVGTMHKIKEKGKIRSVGMSNCTTHHLQDLIDNGIGVSLNQVEYHPYFQQKELAAFCKKQNIHITAYSPLGHGRVFKDPVLKEIGEKYGKNPGQVSLKWLLQSGFITIPKASTVEKLKQNLLLFDFELSPEDLKKIEGLNENERQLFPDFNEFDY